MFFTNRRIMKFLIEDCKGIFSCDYHKGNIVGQPDFNKILYYEVFTIPSQHVRGKTVREALINAIKKSEEKK